jgi:hypothetical protein
MGAKSSAPKTPDYSSLAIQQAGLDKQNAIDLTKMNRINQVDPYGQTTFETTYTPEQQENIRRAQVQYDQYLNDPRYQSGSGAMAQREKFRQDLENAKNQQGTTTQRTTLSPAQQRLLEQQQALQSTQNDRISQLLASFETPTLAAGDMGPQRTLKEADQNNIQSLLYGQITKQYDDRFARQNEARKAELANQGFLAGSEGFNQSNNDFATERNSAYQDAATQAALSSYDQLNKERALNQSEYNTLSTDDINRFQAITSNNLNKYNSQMGFLSQLLGGVQGPTTPNYPAFAQATPYQSADVMGAAQAGYQGNLNSSNAKNAAAGQNMATVGTLASAAVVAF